MPRPAAVILGLALVAFSIGFNSRRYPIVWEMVNPVKATEAAPPAIAPQPEIAKMPATAVSPSKDAEPAPDLVVKPIELAPEPEVGRNVEAVQVPMEKSEPEKPISEQDSSKPLVPVAPTGLSKPSLHGTGEFAIRRLPPVNGSVAAPNLGALTGNSIPVYPSTGLR